MDFTSSLYVSMALKEPLGESHLVPEKWLHSSGDSPTWQSNFEDSQAEIYVRIIETNDDALVPIDSLPNCLRMRDHELTNILLCKEMLSMGLSLQFVVQLKAVENSETFCQEQCIIPLPEAVDLGKSSKSKSAEKEY